MLLLIIVSYLLIFIKHGSYSLCITFPVQKQLCPSHSLQNLHCLIEWTRCYSAIWVFSISNIAQWRSRIFIIDDSSYNNPTYFLKQSFGAVHLFHPHYLLPFEAAPISGPIEKHRCPYTHYRMSKHQCSSPPFFSFAL
ncbi:hypothetical protein MPH_07471 [Macrophomina phaseolina MS6]|uniref:Uncharacterized protein n=1 Tax=Macrophomina phaseolina (strain MS6) TaxID=1126212 RepID=K2RKW5_MACPH|nr:hypothetical protein MPH_07471 [Macrophomina phaseolina MS6]